MIHLRLLTFLCIVLLISGCGMVTDKQAADEFTQVNPKAIIYEQFIGEGDSDHAYMHFRYTEGDPTKKMEQMWVYQRQKNDTWRAIRKEGPKPAGSQFSD